MVFLYNALLALTSPLWFPWTWIRSRRRGGGVRWAERRGGYPPLPPPGERLRVWLHAVSVGEIIAARPILRRLRAHPESPEIVLSVTTTSGEATARQTPELYDHLRQAPVDLLRFTLPAMQRTRPHALVLFETELWLSWLESARTFGAATLLVNGRLSERSFATARRFGFFYRAVLARVDRALMQSAADAERLAALGAEAPETFGNVKFDEALEAPTRGRRFWRDLFGWGEEAFVVVVGSTRGDEEERFVLDAIRELPEARIVWAPRHLERADGLLDLIGEELGPVVRRSTLDGPTREAWRCVVLDTYGELADVYAAGDAAVVGGAFAPLGGQNILQPLARGLPTLHGPHMGNFRDVAAIADEAGATRVCRTPAELAAALRTLMTDAGERSRRSEAARALFAAHAGAADAYVAAIVGEASRARAEMARRAAAFSQRRRERGAGRID